MPWRVHRVFEKLVEEQTVNISRGMFGGKASSSLQARHKWANLMPPIQKGLVSGWLCPVKSFFTRGKKGGGGAWDTAHMNSASAARSAAPTSASQYCFIASQAVHISSCITTGWSQQQLPVVLDIINRPTSQKSMDCFDRA
jgi:hypothetical protein